MAGLLGGADATAQLALAGASAASGKLEEPDHSSANWYFSREEIEKQSPSRLDGIDIKKETYFRKSYCTFLQDLGMRLKVPQVTIATAIVFCHRFFHRQSHKKNDRYMVATVCMFLAGKVEETPRPLREVIMYSYEIRFKKDPAAVQRIRQKDVYEEQKELVLGGERLLLTTLGFDLNVHHPYKPLVAAIKRFKVAQNTLAQVAWNFVNDGQSKQSSSSNTQVIPDDFLQIAWNFVNDGLRTSLCLQFKPHHIAAGAIFLAAKFLKVNLPKDGDKVWWQQFEVTPRQLEEVSNQMLELYEQNKSNGATGSLANDPSPSEMHRGHLQYEAPCANGHHHQQSQVTKSEGVEAKMDEASSRREEEYGGGRVQSSSPLYTPNMVRAYSDPPSERPSEGRQNGVSEAPGVAGTNGRVVAETSVKKEVVRSTEHYHEYREEVKGNGGRVDRGEEGGSSGRERRRENEDWIGKEKTKERTVAAVRTAETVETTTTTKATVVAEEKESRQGFVSLDEVDTDKIKAAMEKRRKSRGGGEAKGGVAKQEPTNEEELLERELESGVDTAAEAEKSVKERREKKVGRGEYEVGGGKEQGSGAKKARVKEEGEAKSRVEHEVTAGKERGAEGNAMKKVGKEQERGVQRERSPERVEEGEVPSTSGTMKSPPRSAEKQRAVADRSLSPGGQKRHYGSREQYENRKEGHKDGRYSSHNREHYSSHHHSSSHHSGRYEQHRTDGERDRHRGDHKEREWSDRDHKKPRHD